MKSLSVHNAGIGARLGGAFGVMALLLLVSMAFGVTRLALLNDSVTSLETQARAAALSSTLVAQAYQAADELGRAVMADGVDVVQASLKNADRLRADSANTKAALAQLLTSDDARAVLKATAAAEPAYRSNLDKVAAAIKGGDTDAARTALNDKALRGAEERYLKALAELEAFQSKAMEMATAQAAAAYTNGRNLLFGAALVASVLAAVLGLWMTRSLTGPAAEAVAVAARIAQGDLTQDVSTTRGDEMGRILNAMQTMQASLRTVVGGVRDSSQSIAMASAEIAHGNHDLSHRTEQQAAALQETAASMEQLGSTVRQNADNAKQANQLARGAAAVAVQGGEVVGQVVRP